MDWIFRKMSLKIFRFFFRICVHGNRNNFFFRFSVPDVHHSKWKLNEFHKNRCEERLFGCPKKYISGCRKILSFLKYAKWKNFGWMNFRMKRRFYNVFVGGNAEWFITLSKRRVRGKFTNVKSDTSLVESEFRLFCIFRYRIFAFT